MAEPEILYNSDGNVISIVWKENGEFHREDGPAVESYFADGRPMYKYWYLHGRFHSISGPAVITYRIFGDGIVHEEQYYLNGQQLTFRDFMLATAASEEEKMLIILQYC